MRRQLPFLLLLTAALAACSREAPKEEPAPSAAPPAAQPSTPTPPAETAPEPTAPAAPAQPALDPIAIRLDRILAAPHRAEGHAQRDQWRKPRDTLMFFGIRPEMTVIELFPGANGWYTEILAPFLRGSGKLIVAYPDPAKAANERAQAFLADADQKFRQKLAMAPQIYDQVEIRLIDTAQPVLGEANSADMVLVFRNVHTFINGGYAEAMFKAIADVLKPGGVLGIEQHRADPNREEDDPKTGYVSVKRVVRLAEAAGLVFEEESELNANPNDTRDHPNGVWTLPPTLRVPEGEDPEKFKAIGESDRMTLRFRKPRAEEAARP